MSFFISATPMKQTLPVHYNTQPIKKRPQSYFPLDDDAAFYAAQRKIVEGSNKHVSFDAATKVATYYRSYAALDCIGYMETGMTK